jgi:RimJ/RimL family protein N-acetyltransferase
MSKNITPNSPETVSLLSGFTVHRGFNRGIAEHLVERSRQPIIQAMAPRDETERFSDVDTALDWSSRSPERIFYSLAQSAHLAGVIWFTPGLLHDAQYTFAVRVYEPYSGRGLGAAFGEVAHEDLEKDYQGAIWADVLSNNQPSQRLARKLGYRMIEGHSSINPERVQLFRPSIDDRPDTY